MAPLLASTKGFEVTFPVYDCAWQLFTKVSDEDARAYMVRAKQAGFDGCWAFIAHHGPVTLQDDHPVYGFRLGYTAQRAITAEYAYHILDILDIAEEVGFKIGVGPIWQNAYFPGGTEASVSGWIGDRVDLRQFLADVTNEIGGHPAIAHWIFGGDVGAQTATDANTDIWVGQTMDDDLPVIFHTGTANYGGHRQYGVLADTVDVIACQTGHQQNFVDTRNQLRTAVNHYRQFGLEVWQGEPRYFGIDFDWVGERWRNPNGDIMKTDAAASLEAGVTGALVGHNDRWQGLRLVESFDDDGPWEEEVIAIYRSNDPANHPEPEPNTMNDHPVLAAILDQTPPGVPHDRPLPLNPGWDFTSAGRLSSWEDMGAPNLDHIELRGIFWRHEQTGPVTIGIRNASYWSYTNAYGWDREFDATPQGAYMGTVGTIDNPYVNGKGNFNANVLDGESTIRWVDGYSRAIHWWAGKRHPIHSDQRAELAVAEVFVTGNDQILAAIGTDYYDSPSMNSTRAPGAGIARHIVVEPGRWVTLAWLTVPEIDADDVSATTLREWLEAHPLPDVGIGAGSDVVIIEPEPEPEPPTPEPEPTGEMVRMDVYARGTTGQEVITVNGVDARLTTKVAVYVFDAPADLLRVEFNNDATPPDRNVFIDAVVIFNGDDEHVFAPDDTNVLSAGTWVPGAGECVSGMGLGPWIHCNGYKDFTDAYATRTAAIDEPPTPETPTGCTLDEVKNVLVELGPCEAMQLMLEAFGWEQ